MLALTDLGGSLQVATIVAPVAVYFLVLGLLNSRKHPQVLTGRQDFWLMLLAMSPVFAVPVLRIFGFHIWSLSCLGGAMALIGGLFAPGKNSWVIYNMPANAARRAVGNALADLGQGSEKTDEGCRIPETDVMVKVSAFSLLRNVTVTLSGGSDEIRADLEANLSRRIGRLNAETSPMAVSLLLVSIGMLVVPTTLVAHRMPEIVRLLEDLVK
ncbi:MAG: hypothetical protein ACLFVU_13025 [Phycisphaerae bacterium]